VRGPLLALAFLAIASLLCVPASAASATPSASHYLPQAGDGFGYYETIFLTNGVGNYSGYSEASYYNGSISVTSVLPNATESASYQASGIYTNSGGGSAPWSESGSFTFSASTYHYVQGTDNQTGYVDPYVWFYIDNLTPVGGTVNLLNTPMNVASRDDAYPSSLSSTGAVVTIFAEGNGSYERDDAYGTFQANYTWQAYFDPATGYIVGYQYTETDRDGSGDGFTWTDTLSDTSTTFALTAAGSSGSSSSSFPWLLVIVVLVVILILVVIAVALSRRHRRGALPRHPTTTVPGALPTYGPPPGINLTPRDQPTIQQVVVRETVKVPCRYCGTLMDSTATNCPNCGAPRT
jgi:hypothetical protein